MRTDRRVGAVGARFAALALAVGGCGADTDQEPGTAATSSAGPTQSAETPAPGDHQLAMDWDGMNRTYELHAPPGYQPGQKLPLVVAMHHRGGTAATMREMTLLDAKADTEGFLVAYPNGLDNSFNALICCGDNDDIGFIRSIVEHVTLVWGADADRVYATGISNGADMTFRLAVEAPGTFAAIAPVSGGFIGPRAQSEPSFKPSKPVSVVSFLGSNDRSIRVLEVGLASWYGKVGCTAGDTTWVDAGNTVNRTTASCTDQTEVVSYLINGMGHAWPGGTEEALGDPTTKINAVDVMWEFFELHPRVA
jgi:polyhydroxybutyrate depolymerase